LISDYSIHDVIKKLNYKVEPGAVIYPNCTIGEHSIIGANAVLRPGTVIGHHSIFGTLSVSEGNNSIGNYTTIHAQCHITQGVRIGDNVFIAPFFIASNTKEITKGKHGTDPSVLAYVRYPCIIGDNVRIGINVGVIPGITIGNDAVIDQDCLITKDVLAGQHIRGGKDKIGRSV
jgi:UDP-3-O-[3-hydroxymyristoyl] glucosamine N-acyltransferase